MIENFMKNFDCFLCSFAIVIKKNYLCGNEKC